LENYLIANGYNYEVSTNGDWTSNNKIAKAYGRCRHLGSSGDVGSPGNTDVPSKRNSLGFTARARGREDFHGSFGFFLSNGPGSRMRASTVRGGEFVRNSGLRATTAWWHEISTYSTGLLPVITKNITVFQVGGVIKLVVSLK
jgi:hypothetical protein